MGRHLINWLITCLKAWSKRRLTGRLSDGQREWLAWDRTDDLKDNCEGSWLVGCELGTFDDWVQEYWNGCAGNRLADYILGWHDSWQYGWLLDWKVFVFVAGEVMGGWWSVTEMDLWKIGRSTGAWIDSTIREMVECWSERMVHRTPAYINIPIPSF